MRIARVAGGKINAPSIGRKFYLSAEPGFAGVSNCLVLGVAVEFGDDVFGDTACCRECPDMRTGHAPGVIYIVVAEIGQFFPVS